MVQVLAHFLNPLKIVFLALFSVLSCGKNDWVFFFFFFFWRFFGVFMFMRVREELCCGWAYFDVLKNSSVRFLMLR